MTTGRRRPPILVVAVAFVAVAFFALPLIGLLQKASWSSLGHDLTTPVARDALRLSLVCSLSATALSVLFGLPLAWVLARVEFPGKPLVRGLVLLPLVLPPVVGGVALLAAFSNRGIVNNWLDALFGFRVQLTFTTAGAILAETFVALPFFVITVEAALRSMDRRYEDVAATLGRRAVDGVPAGHAADDPAVGGRRSGPGVGPGPRRVRRHHHLRRQHHRAHPDPAAGGLPAARVQPRRGHRPEPRAAGGVARADRVAA